MSSNRNIHIWIGIVSLIGIILLMVACETGVLKINKNQAAKPETAGQGRYAQGSAGTERQDAETPTPSDHAATAVENISITVGRPYSKKLTDEGSRNVLIIGQDKVSNLYDTIGIASINSANKTVKLIMIPRDTYIEYNPDIMSRLEAKGLAHEPGIYKINYSHHIGKIMEYKGRFDSGPISFLADVIGEKFGIVPDDYIKINTEGFRELIDYLGGVEMYVPYNMDYEDPLQDLYIHIDKGNRLLDGENAEGFVRFRQGYREDGTFMQIGDLQRKKNQLNFLQQLIKQKGNMRNIGKIPGIIGILGKNVQHSVGFGELLQTYMGIATNIISDKYEIISVNIDSEEQIWVDGSACLVVE
ncbi:MAG TPA: LCP family protein [Clostridia bacterium]|nr:LCP family protein [Clostridia bacterium]